MVEASPLPAADRADDAAPPDGNDLLFDTELRPRRSLSRGGFYAEGTPMHAFEHLETYLRGVFGFVGVTRLEVFAANGIAMGEAARTEALENASQAIASLTV